MAPGCRGARPYILVSHTGAPQPPKHCRSLPSALPSACLLSLPVHCHLSSSRPGHHHWHAWA